MGKNILSKEETRKIVLKNQILDKKYELPAEKIINKLGYLQIDTISILERSHNHILWTRSGKDLGGEINKLISRKKIFEYWDHAASYLPVNHYRYSLFRKNNFKKNYKNWFNAHKKIVNHILERIKNEGALMSKDFESEGNKRTGWWDWKPAKRGLEMLFHSGELVISERRNFQKVYELRDRFYPEFTELKIPKEEEYYEFLVLKTIDSYGLATRKEILYLRKKDNKLFEKVVMKLIEEKVIIETRVEGTEAVYYTRPEILKKGFGKNENNEIHILNPFDNLIIQRERTKFLFNFDYVIECYVPEKKRIFGYYVLPVLYGDKFIGRIDAKADRKNKELLVFCFYKEKGFKSNKEVSDKFKQRLKEFAKFTKCDKVSMLFN